MGPPITLSNSISIGLLMKSKDVVEYRRKLCFLRRGHVWALLARGPWPPAPPFYRSLYRVASCMEQLGYCPRVVQDYVAMERRTLEKHRKFDKFPPCPLHNPYPYLKSYDICCSHGALLWHSVGYFQIWQGVLEKYVPPQSCRFR